MKNYYQLLGIERNASKEEVKKAYRLYAMKFHPDKQFGDDFFEERFKEIKEAYDVLSDDIKRVKYDNKFNSNNRNKKTNSAYFDSSFLKKENELKKKEELLKRKEDEIQKKLIELDKKRKEDFVKWEKEKLSKKENEFNEREKTVYFEKGNVLITGNFLRVGEKRYELDEIYTISIKKVSKRKVRLAGWAMLFLGILTLGIFIGFFILIFSFTSIFKRDESVITLSFKDRKHYYIKSEKKLAFKILENIEKVKNRNKEKYHNY